MRPCLVVAVFLSACGGTEGGDDPLEPFASGARLRAIVRDAGDGARALAGWNDTEPGDDHHNRVRALLALYTPSIVAELPRIRTAAIEAQIAKLEEKLTRLRAQLAS